MVSHFISSCDGKTDSRNQTKHQYIQEAFVSNIAKIEKAQNRWTQYDFIDIFMVPTINDKNVSHPVLIWNDDQHIFLIGTQLPFKTFAYGKIVSIRDVVKTIK